MCGARRARCAAHFRGVVGGGMNVEAPLDRSMTHAPVVPRSLALRVALLAGAVALPTAAAAQAPTAAEPTTCFAQPRAQRAAADTARTPSTGAAGAGAEASRPAPDIILLASVSARSVRFNSEPRISVRLCGGFDSVRVVERRNLPERVVPGVTYRDVYVAVEILGHIYADCLRDALTGAAPRGQPCPTPAASPRDTTRGAGRRPR
jgi:hypothetical protein